MKNLLLVILVLISGNLMGQYRIKSSVFGNGGSLGSNSSFHLYSTTGQSFIGIMQANGYRVNNGFWNSIQIPDAVDNQNDIIPLKFELEQNYPNPFNPSTKIKYSIPHISQVQIKVYDILGNEIQTLLNEDKSAGTYELIWNAVNFPSGVYFYQIRAGDFVETKKMLLLK